MVSDLNLKNNSSDQPTLDLACLECLICSKNQQKTCQRTLNTFFFLCVKMLLKCKYFTVDQSKTSEEGGGCQEWTQLTRLPPFTSTKAR